LGNYRKTLNSFCEKCTAPVRRVKSKNTSKITMKGTLKNQKNAVLRKVQGRAKVLTEMYTSYDEGKNCSSNDEIFQQCSFLVGVDEAGRGPLAGPVAIGVAVVPAHFDWNLIPGVGDSKKVSPKNREAIFRRAKMLKKQKQLNFAVTLVSASIIDRIGITRAVTFGITRAFQKLNLNPKDVDVRLDGLLKAPVEYQFQQTIIKGDAKEKIIGLASIVAKVTRDAHMVRIARDYPQYNFEIHKGYGTQKHRNALKKFGMTSLHRKTFCRNICTMIHTNR